MAKERAVVVGAGLGGLSAAAYLSKNGFKVDVLERNSYAGGYACSFVRGRFEFEAALHALSGLGPEGNRGGCWKVLEGCDVAGKVEFIPIPEFYSAVFPDFRITIPFGWQEAEEAYAKQFPDEREGIHRTLQFMRKMFEEMQVVSGEPSTADLLAFPVKGSHLIRSTGLTCDQFLAREMKDERLKSLFCDLWGYYGLPRSRLSWQLFAAGNASYLEHGPYHVKGTSQALSNAFVDVIEENGGRVHLRNGAEKITVESQRVTAVTAESGDEFPADYVVCSANPIHTCYDLIGADKVPKSYLKQLGAGHIAISTFNVYMGLDCPADALAMEGHELFINDDYDQDRHYLDMFNVVAPSYWVVTNYNCADPGFSPPGTCVVVLTTLMDYGAWERVPPDRYVEVKNRLAEELIAKTEKHIGSFKDHIEVVEVSTPVTNMRYSNNPGGSILGFDYSVTGSSLLRLPNRGPLDRLYFANAWVRIGGGFEPCMTSGFFAFAEVMKDAMGVTGLKKIMPGY